MTEKELARHNSMYEQTFCNTEEEERGEGKRLLDRVDERCELLKKEFESRMKRLEEQLTKTEQEFSQSRCDIEELHSMEKEYINQGIQTDLRCEDIEKIQVKIKAFIKVQIFTFFSLFAQEVAETMNSTSPNEIKEWKENYGNMEQFTNQAKRLIWDTPFIPVHSICRQLPTHVNEEDVCDYHRQRIEVLKLKSEKEKSLYQKDNQATLDKISHWAGAIKRSSLL